MEFFRIRRDIPFMRHALVFNIVSLVTFLLAVLFLATRGLNLGVDFKGGTLIEIAYPHAADLGGIRTAIDKMNLGEFAVQSFGSANSALIRLPLKEGVSSAQLSERVMTALRADDPSATQQRVEFVGPQVGKELYENGALALLLVLSILFFGGETLHYFALALAIGICFGIYSSALVMAALVMWLGVSREDLVKPEKRAGAGIEKILP